MRKIRAKSMVTQIKHNENQNMIASNSALHKQYLKQRESELLKKNETLAQFQESIASNTAYQRQVKFNTLQ
jgi:hypothetical protein